MKMNKAQAIIKELNLIPHPEEGGYFRETYRDENKVSVNLDSEIRNLNTAIYYLLTPETFSEMHILPSVELFHFYAGDPVEMLNLKDGQVELITLGSDVLAGHIPQHTVAPHTWQGCRLKAGGEYALLGCTVTPGFEFKDYGRGKYSDLSKEYPDAPPLLKSLCRI